jgi:hypothetical protein
MKPSPHIEYQQHDSIYLTSYAPAGKRLIIMGEANNGPYYEPIYAPNTSVAQTYFQSGQLLDRQKDALLFDPNLEIYLMRIDKYGFVSALDYLKTYEFDLLYCDTIRFGENTEDILAFIDFAHEKEQQGILVHGIFDLMPFQYITELESVEKLIRSFTFDSLFHVEEDGKYLSVVVDQFQDHKAGAVYAGMIASLDVGVSPLNKSINVQLKQEFNKKEIMYFEQTGIVSFRSSLKKGVVCATCPCAVYTPGVHKNVANFRIAQSVILDVSSALSSFIGRTGISSQGQEIQELLISILDEYRQKEILREYAFGVISAYLEGVIYVELEIVPIFTTEKMIAHTQVRIKR